MKYGWSLELEDWKKLRNANKGLEWRRAFLERDYAKDVPQHSGVYLICASPRTIPIDNTISGDTVMKSFYSAMYVGRTRNLRQRFGQYINTSRPRLVATKRVFRRLDFWFSTLDISLLPDVEQILISAFGPTANDRNATARIGKPIPAGRKTGDRK